MITWMMIVGVTQILLSQDSLNFGRMGWNDTTAVVDLVNVGTDTLEILGISTSCGCTKAFIDPQRIPPGGHATLTITFSPASHRIQGEVYREVYLRTNSSSDSVIMVRVYAQVTPPSWAVNRALPDYIFQTPSVQKAYGYVVEHQDEIAQFPCYCGCGSTDEHQNLADCYVQHGEFQDHASTCAVCVSEVLDIIRLHGQGESLKRIQKYIQETYRIYGNPTPNSP